MKCSRTSTAIQTTREQPDDKGPRRQEFGLCSLVGSDESHADLFQLSVQVSMHDTIVGQLAPSQLPHYAPTKARSPNSAKTENST